MTRYLRREVAAHSPLHRARLQAAGASFDRLPLTSLHEIDGSEAGALVLRPTWDTLTVAGSPAQSARIIWARLWRRHERALARIVDPRYKPVHWVLAEGVPVGSSAADLHRLGVLGGHALTVAGVTDADVLVGMLPAGPDIGATQLTLGARRHRVPAMHVGPSPDAATIAALRPTVLAGRSSDLLRFLRKAEDDVPRLRDVTTILVVGELVDAGLRRRLHTALHNDDVRVVAWWAPPGVRALWAQCPGATGLHTWPGTEHLELVDPLSGTAVVRGKDGELVWSPVGWRGTVLLRLRTGAYGTLEWQPCPSCGRPGPRFLPTSTTPSFLASLDRHPRVRGWQAELRTVDGVEELIVFLVPDRRIKLDELLVALDAELSATQYVILDRRSLDRRLARHDERRVIDLRT